MLRAPCRVEHKSGLDPKPNVLKYNIALPCQRPFHDKAQLLM